ncbi:hypothetical protein C8T65DRAFT_231438 [Cerioporus squamosus]|nr:hypothetical protein C8T65DRAFT_231438 [Cerioporus squamosus]
MPASVAPDDHIIVISSDEEDCKDELDVQEDSVAEETISILGVGRESHSYAPQNGMLLNESQNANSVLQDDDPNGAAAASTSQPPSTRVGTSDNVQARDTWNDETREDCAVRRSQCRSPDCPAHQTGDSSQPSLPEGTQDGGIVGVIHPSKLEEEDRIATDDQQANRYAEVHALNTQPCKTVDFHDYWRRTEVGQSRVTFIQWRNATLGATSQEQSALREPIAKYSTMQKSSPEAASMTTPRRSLSARASSTTLHSEPPSPTANPSPDLPVGAPQDAAEDHATSHEVSDTHASVVLSQADEDIAGASPTPSDMEVDELIQMDGGDSESSQVRAIPSPPASPPQRSSSSASHPHYVIPADVPWRQAYSDPTFFSWERTSAIPPKPAPSQLAGVSSPQVGQTHLVIESLQRDGLYTIADSDQESSPQDAHSIDVHVRPPPGETEDPVVKFLGEVSLSPALAETLREVGISDEPRMRALGALHWRSLEKLDKALEQAGLDYVARLLIRDGLKRRAARK